jgi:hypothetical protein
VTARLGLPLTDGEGSHGSRRIEADDMRQWKILVAEQEGA